MADSPVLKRIRVIELARLAPGHVAFHISGMSADYPFADSLPVHSPVSSWLTTERRSYASTVLFLPRHPQTGIYQQQTL